MGRDAKQGYYRNLVAPNSDGPTFKVLTSELALDQNQVYLGAKKGAKYTWLEARGGGVIALEGADPSTFRLLESEVHSNYVADATHVWYRGEIIQHADPATFRKSSHGSKWRDDNYLYHFTERIETTINGEVVPAKVDDLEPISGTNYLTDGRGVWHSSHFQPIPDADPKTFQELKTGFTKDAKHVWHTGKLIEGFDAKTFKVNPDNSIEDASGRIPVERDPRNVRGPRVKYNMKPRKKKEEGKDEH